MKNINIINLIIYEIHGIFKMIKGGNKNYCTRVGIFRTEYSVQYSGGSGFCRFGMWSIGKINYCLRKAWTVKGFMCREESFWRIKITANTNSSTAETVSRRWWKNAGCAKREKEMSYLKTLLIICPIFFISGIIDSIGGGGGLIALPTYLMIGLPVRSAWLQQTAGRSWKSGLSDQVF